MTVSLVIFLYLATKQSQEGSRGGVEEKRPHPMDQSTLNTTGEAEADIPQAARRWGIWLGNKKSFILWKKIDI